MSMVNCPNCGAEVSQLIPVEAGLRARLKDVAGITTPPTHVCENCQGSLKESMSQGAILMAAEKQRAEYRKAVWATRINHVKLGRQFMERKMFSEAAVEYEKYIRTLEVAMDAETDGLSAKQFKDPKYKKELTVIASVYWDLLVIYDSSGRFANRLSKAATKLQDFARYTPLFPDIVKRANTYSRRAKNPAVFTDFVRSAQADRPRCFVANAVFADSGAWPVLVLRGFRDHDLRRFAAGRKFIHFYYRHSPAFALWLKRKSPLSKLLRTLLWPLLWLLAALLYLRNPNLLLAKVGVLRDR